MGKMLAALLRLQTVERDLVQVRRRLQTRKNAVAIQQQKIDQLTTQYNAIREKSMNRRKDADRLELDLKQKEAQVAKLRTALNTAKTNKEYAAILTELNTHRADNAKVEEEVLKIMQDADAVKVDLDKLQLQIDTEQGRLKEIEANSAEEVTRLTGIMDQLATQRAAAATEVPDKSLQIFERLSESCDGEAMAIIEIHGRKSPFDYVCGGCYMSLNAEHANALRTRDEIRTCDNCKRILYMEDEQKRPAKAE